MALQVIEETLTVGEPGGLHGCREGVLFGHSVCPVPEVLIHSLGDQLLAHSTVLAQPGQGSPRRSLDGLPEAFKEAVSAD
uniref:Uncharacterized protein n=1 Tax=Lepeophtheirus salmonis TaxID=72036 RepID=A0A0K2T6Z0_LEPSM